MHNENNLKIFMLVVLVFVIKVWVVIFMAYHYNKVSIMYPSPADMIFPNFSTIIPNTHSGPERTRARLSDRPLQDIMLI